MPADAMTVVGGRETRVLSAGAKTAPVVVWLHDSLGNRWSAAHDALSEGGYRVLAPSLPGVEDSSTLDGIDSAEDVVFWLVDLLEALQLDRPVLLGCGLGGWMAAEFAVRYPSALGGLILVDAYGLRVEGSLAEDEFALTPPMLRPLVFAEPNGEVAHDTLPDTPLPERLEPALHARVAAARLAWQFPYNRKLRSRLGRARIPALVIWGAQDRLVSVAHGHTYTEALPDARLVVIPDAGHYPHLEAPDAFARAIQDFLTRA